MDNSDIKPGDMLWVTLKGPDQNYGYGEVIEVWKDDESGETYYDFHCLVNGGQRVGCVSDIIDKPNMRMENKLLQSRKEYKEVMKEKYKF